tara:strand:+ start:349 stop:978 length:630 start_codon:yes stop_codon:yes gene_type:complete
MTPLEDRIKWGITPYDDDAEKQHSSESEHGEDDGYDLDARLDAYLEQGLASDDGLGDADDEDSEYQAETDTRSEISTQAKNSDNRYQNFDGEEIAEDATYYEESECMQDEEEGETHDGTMQTGNRANRDSTLQDVMEEDIAGEDEEVEDMENKENEEQAGKHGGSKMSSNPSKRVKLTEMGQSEKSPVSGHTREKCAVDGMLYGLFADD